MFLELCSSCTRCIEVYCQGKLPQGATGEALGMSAPTVKHVCRRYCLPRSQRLDRTLQNSLTAARMVYTSHRWASTAWLADTVGSGAKSLRYGGSPPYKHGRSATTAHPGFWMLQAHAKPGFGGFACTSDDLPNIAHGEKGESSPFC